MAVYAAVMIVLLKRQARRAEESAVRAAEAAARAEELAQAKSRFLAMMSHELRTPLNAVIGFAEFLGKEDEDGARRREYIGGILASAKALLDLINDIPDLSKLEMKAMRMRTGACPVQAIMSELPAIFGHRVAERGVELVVRKTGAADVPDVQLSRQGLRQVLINLVGSATKFTRDGTITVEYGWVPETSTLHMEIRDTGSGISEEKMAHLFDSFVQDISSRMHQGDTAEKGTGLGLPIVKRLVDSAGGTITVDTAEGHGTKFVIDFPDLETVEAPSASPAPVEIPAPAPASGAPKGNIAILERFKK